MADDASRSSLFGGAAARNVGKVNKYADVGAPVPQAPPIDPATIDMTEDEKNKHSLVAGGKKKVDIREPEPEIEALDLPEDDGGFEDVQFDFDDLNITEAVSKTAVDGDDGALDFAAIDDDLARFEQDEFVRDALQRGVDLRAYSKQVDSELHTMEMSSIADYVRESDSIAALFEQITSCENVLSQMQGLLQGFQSNLGGISDEIRYLQEESLTLTDKMQNRKNVGAKVRAFLAKVAVPESLIDRITDAEINESWLRDLRSLKEKLDFLYSSNRGDGSSSVADSLSDLTVDPFTTPAAKQSVPILRQLQVKAVSRCREHLARMIQEVVKPRTSIQKQQDYLLLKYEPLMSFLNSHGVDRERGIDAAREIHTMYGNEVGAVYTEIFKRYCEELSKLSSPPSIHGDLLGTTEAVSSGKGLPLGPFSLGDRAMLLSDLDTCTPLQAHVVAAEKKLIMPEEIFRSIIRHFSDVSEAEWKFCRKFFGPVHAMEVYFATMGKAGEAVSNFVVEHVNSNSVVDAPGLFLELAILSRAWQHVGASGCSGSDSVFIKSVGIIQRKWKSVFDANVQSLRSLERQAARIAAAGSQMASPLSALPPVPAGSKPSGSLASTILPIFVRACEFLAAHTALCSSLGHSSIRGDQAGSAVDQSLLEAESAFFGALSAVARELPSSVARAALELAHANQLQIAVHSLGGSSSPSGARLAQRTTKFVAVYAVESVESAFKSVLEFLRNTENSVWDEAPNWLETVMAAAANPGAPQRSFLPPLDPNAGQQKWNVNPADLEAAVKEFNINYQPAIQALADDVARFFRDQRLQASTLMVVFATVASVHHRLGSIVERAFGSGSVGKDLVVIQALYSEMRRYGRH